MMKQVIITLDEKHVPTLVGLVSDIADELIVRNLEARKKPTPSARQHWVRGPDSASAQAMTKIEERINTSSRAFHKSEFLGIAKELGLKSTTLSPILSQMVKEGRVKRDGKGLFKSAVGE